MKRIRRGLTPPGVLRLRYGILTGEKEPDLVALYGDGARGTTALLLSAFGSKRWTYKGMNGPMEPSLLEELEARGYDLSTLEFSIRKKDGDGASAWSRVRGSE